MYQSYYTSIHQPNQSNVTHWRSTLKGLTCDLLLEVRPQPRLARGGLDPPPARPVDGGRDGHVGAELDALDGPPGAEGSEGRAAAVLSDGERQTAVAGPAGERPFESVAGAEDLRAAPGRVNQGPGDAPQGGRETGGQGGDVQGEGLPEVGL